MEINSDILDKLTCSDCTCYLSRSPIYLKKDGTAVCGRCPVPAKPALRNYSYENLVEMMSFPCMYKKEGCPDILAFPDLKNHEESCEHRKYICPVMPSGECEWIGTASKLLEHCKSKHKNRVLEHPCILEHDILQNSQKSYITEVCNVLFLIHTKICLISGKIFHSVHTIRNVKTDIEYTIDIQRNKLKVVKSGIVAPLGCMAIKENLSVACNINSLLEILEGFTDTTFTITILAEKNRVDFTRIKMRNSRRVQSLFSESSQNQGDIIAPPRFLRMKKKVKNNNANSFVFNMNIE